MRNTMTETVSVEYPEFPREARVRRQLQQWEEKLEEYATKHRCAAAFLNGDLAREPVFGDLTETQQSQLPRWSIK